MGRDALLPGLGDFEYVVTVVGLLYVLKVLLQALWAVAWGVRAHIWSRLWQKRLVEDYGKWAVVTGATDGIGKEYAKQLARRGMNVLLISRSMEKLQNVSTEIAQEYNVQTEVVQADFLDGRPIYEDIARHLQDKEVGVLVNNVGVGNPNSGGFMGVSESHLWSLINVNVASVPAMTRLVLPGMLRRGRGAVVNIASITSTNPISSINIYSASKAFVRFFSMALEWEYRDCGITVQTLIPAFVLTNMTSIKGFITKTTLTVPSASTYAANAIHTLGYASFSTGYWAHGILAHIYEHILNTWGWRFVWDTVIFGASRNMKKNQE